MALDLQTTTSTEASARRFGAYHAPSPIGQPCRLDSAWRRHLAAPLPSHVDPREIEIPGPDGSVRAKSFERPAASAAVMAG